MSSLEIFAVIISLVGVTLTIKRNMWCWWFNFAAFLLYAYLFYTYKLYGETILQFFFVVVNFYGFYHWLKGKQQDHEIRIEPITARQVILQMLLAAVVGAAFGLSLKYLTDAAVPLLDRSSQRLVCWRPIGPVVNILPHGCCGYLSILFMSVCLSIKICS